MELSDTLFFIGKQFPSCAVVSFDFAYRTEDPTASANLDVVWDVWVWGGWGLCGCGVVWMWVCVGCGGCVGCVGHTWAPYFFQGGGGVSHFRGVGWGSGGGLILYFVTHVPYNDIKHHIITQIR
jgi:hypothetical protein